MRDDYASFAMSVSDLRQPAPDILIGQPVKSVAADAFLVERLGDA